MKLTCNLDAETTGPRCPLSAKVLRKSGYSPIALERPNAIVSAFATRYFLSASAMLVCTPASFTRSFTAAAIPGLSLAIVRLAEVSPKRHALSEKKSPELPHLALRTPPMVTECTYSERLEQRRTGSTSIDTVPPFQTILGNESSTPQPPATQAPTIETSFGGKISVSRMPDGIALTLIASEFVDVVGIGRPE